MWFPTPIVGLQFTNVAHRLRFRAHRCLTDLAEASLAKLFQCINRRQVATLHQMQPLEEVPSVLKSMHPTPTYHVEKKLNIPQSGKPFPLHSTVSHGHSSTWGNVYLASIFLESIFVNLHGHDKLLVFNVLIGARFQRHMAGRSNHNPQVVFYSLNKNQIDNVCERGVGGCASLA